MKARALLLLAALSAVTPAGVRAEVIRHPIPNSTFPIAQAVQVQGTSRPIMSAARSRRS